MNPDDKTLVSQSTGESPRFPGTHDCPQCGLSLPLTVVVCPQDGSLLTGQTIADGKLAGNYDFVEVIGSGGMGVIYKARHPILKKLVAIKMLHMHLLSDAIVKRFEQEAQAASSLSHPNIIQVHDFGVSPHGQPYMVMDFVEGEPLSNVLHRNPMRIEPALNVLIQVADALAHAHEKGVLHRDLKPSNIMVTDADCSFPEIKIVDFGIAKVLETNQTRMTLTGELMGTPYYMSPEQCRGTTLDARSDIYSLGCVMFELLTGRTPFARGSAISAIVGQLTAAAPTLAETRPDIVFPELLEEVQVKMLAKEPGDRYQSMQELIADLIKVQKAYVAATSSGKKKLRLGRNFQENRQLYLVSLAAVASLIFSTAWIGQIAQHAEQESEQRSYEQITVTPQQPSLSILQRKQQEMERQEVWKVADKSKVDDKFMQTFLDFDIGINELDMIGTRITNNGLLYVSLQKHLTRLRLANTEVTDTGLKFLQLLPRLNTLNLDDTQVTDAGMKFLQPMRALRTLSLSGTRISDEGLKLIQHLHLRNLHLVETNTGDTGLAAISNIRSLETLELKRAKGVTDKGVASLARLPRLRVLDLERTFVTDEGLRHLSMMPSLAQIDLEADHITVRGLAMLAKLPRLTALDLNGTEFDDSWVSVLSGFHKLNRLELKSTDITDDGVALLTKALPNLEHLELAKTKITDSSLTLLQSMHKLKHLDLKDCKVSDKAVQELKARIPACNVIKR